MGDIAQGQQVSKKLPAKQLIPYVLLVVGAVAMAVSFFLPLRLQQRAIMQNT